jgi:ferritin-like metal-binding protein YciE
MSGQLASPRDLFLQLLSQMLWLERMLAFEVLPSLRREVKSETLAAAVEQHLAQTHEHVARVETAFRNLGAEPVSARSATGAALIDEHEELAQSIVDFRLADLFNAGAASRGEHLEIAGYDLLLELAQVLGNEDNERLLAANRDDDAKALEQLRSLGRRLRDELAAS